MNRSYTSLNAVGTVVHETADPGATDENEYNYFNTGNRGASAHAFVDNDSITQTIPWNEQAWHAGQSANSNFIGIELCHFDNPGSFGEVWKRAVWLFAYVHVNIIKQPSITKDNLMSHAEVSQKWHETDHNDPLSYFAEFGKTVDDFRNEVQAAINTMMGGDYTPSTIPIIKQVMGWSTDTLQLQKNLNRIKIKDSSGNSIDEDGFQGPRTTEAIKRFQNVAGIMVDGISGNQTNGAINAILAKPVLSYGSKGIPVRYLQFRVGTSIDGDFGPRTRSSVVAYQRFGGLWPDGVVGALTWRSLIG